MTAMQTLAQIPFFKDATDLDYAKFDRRCSWKKYDEGEIVIDYEDDSSEVYFIVAGDVRILIRTAAGKEIILADIKAGQFFGELAAIDGAKRTANVTALTRAELCIMPAPTFRDILFHSPTCCDKVLRLLTKRVRELDGRLAEHTMLDLKHRLFSELLRLSSPRAGHPAERIVSPPPYHHVFAARIGCRREQVTRELSALTSEGLVEKTRGGLVLLKPKVLEMRIAEALRTGD
jgi:CRP/FNR family cyclic AMP-dependent transcriptional regulator